MYGFLRGLMRLMTRTALAGGLFQVSGLDLVPRSGGLIVCANHSSTVDPPLVPAFLPREDSWSMAKSEYFARSGFNRWLFTQYQAFPVVRHSADRRALKRAIELLEKGQSLVIYPEGTRVIGGGLKTAEPGVGFIARGTRQPVLPVALVGTRACFPKGARLPRRVPVSINFGAPIRICERRLGGQRVANQEAADAIMLKIAEMLPPAMRGAYSDLVALRARLSGVWEPAQPFDG